MFDMSDGEDDVLSAKIRPPRFIEVAKDGQETGEAIGSPESPWATVQKSSYASPFLSGNQQDVPIKSITPLPPPIVQAPRAPGQPWGTTPLSSTKLDLKDIMSQAGPSAPSNLSLGFSKDRDQRAASAPNKMSQKERKRLQQAAQLGTPIEKPQPAPPTVSPWQAKSSRQTSSSPMAMPVSQPSPKLAPQPSRSSSTPQLTMRQTVANNGASKKKGKQTAAQQQTTSPNSPSKRPAANERGMSVSTDPIPTPHSVRHIPLPQHSPSSPSQHLSMMEILSLEEAKKTSIRDAAAKRSLQEIQQEQEFQAWWDEESKRVTQEEEQRKRAEDRTTRNAARARGKPRAGRAGKPKSKDAKVEDDDRGKQKRDVAQVAAAAEFTPTASTPRQEGSDRGRGRGRGHRGSRGGARGGRPPTTPRDGQYGSASAVSAGLTQT